VDIPEKVQLSTLNNTNQLVYILQKLATTTWTWGSARGWRKRRGRRETCSTSGGLHRPAWPVASLASSCCPGTRLCGPCRRRSRAAACPGSAPHCLCRWWGTSGPRSSVSAPPPPVRSPPPGNRDSPQDGIPMAAGSGADMGSCCGAYCSPCVPVWHPDCWGLGICNKNQFQSQESQSPIQVTRKRKHGISPSGRTAVVAFVSWVNLCGWLRIDPWPAFVGIPRSGWLMLQLSKWNFLKSNAIWLVGEQCDQSGGSAKCRSN